jgi:L-asparaginase
MTAIEHVRIGHKAHARGIRRYQVAKHHYFAGARVRTTSAPWRSKPYGIGPSFPAWIDPPKYEARSQLSDLAEELQGGVSPLVLIDAGGTIASVLNEDGVLIGRRGGSDLGSATVGEVIERQAYAGLSEDMQMGDAMRVVALVDEAAAAKSIGVVITHGTDMMEEVAFLTHLFHDTDMPVIFTGAQRAPALPGYDGAANLRDALAVARSTAARGIGVAIVFAGRVLTARTATKQDSAAPDAFGPDSAMLARVDEHGLRIASLPRPSPTFARVSPDPAVHIVSLGLETAPELIEALVSSGARALVIEGFGRGNVPMRLIPAIEHARAAGVLIGLATHCHAGGVAPAYESGARLAALGAIGAGDLSARKLRLLLAVALGGGRDADEATHLAQDWLGRSGT